jgi:hypothetical protein
LKKRWLRFCPTPNTEFDHTNKSQLNIPEMNFTTNSIIDQAIPTISKDLKSLELTWWDWTVFLLHTAGEVEHAFMVQYLYARYSLGEPPFRGSKVLVNAEELVRRSRYRMLLMYLYRAIELEIPMIVNGKKTIRGYLRDWTF